MHGAMRFVLDAFELASCHESAGDVMAVRIYACWQRRKDTRPLLHAGGACLGRHIAATDPSRIRSGAADDAR